MYEFIFYFTSEETERSGNLPTVTEQANSRVRIKYQEVWIKALVLNDHDILPPKHELYLYSLNANKMIKEKKIR